MLFGKANIAKNKLDNFEFTDGHNVCPSVNHLFTYMNKEKKKVFDWQPSDVIIEEAQTIFEFMLDNNEVDTDIDNNVISKYEEIFGVDDDK